MKNKPLNTDDIHRESLSVMRHLESVVLNQNAHFMDFMDRFETIIGTVKRMNSTFCQASGPDTGAVPERHEKLCMFIHPAVDSRNEWAIHDEIKRLVRRQRIQEICHYLVQLKNERKVLLPVNALSAYWELVRLGMPQGEGFSQKTFQKYYNR